MARLQGGISLRSQLLLRVSVGEREAKSPCKEFRQRDPKPASNCTRSWFVASSGSTRLDSPPNRWPRVLLAWLRTAGTWPSSLFRSVFSRDRLSAISTTFPLSGEELRTQPTQRADSSVYSRPNDTLSDGDVGLTCPTSFCPRCAADDLRGHRGFITAAGYASNSSRSQN